MVGLAFGGDHPAADVVLHVGALSNSTLRAPSGTA